ncbi:MAG: hypothetical protein AAFQ90_09545 [Pseudomonadota bacterium]
MTNLNDLDLTALSNDELTRLEVAINRLRQDITMERMDRDYPIPRGWSFEAKMVVA